MDAADHNPRMAIGQFPIYGKFPGGKGAIFDLIEAKTGKRPGLNVANVWFFGPGRIPAKHVVTILRECHRLGIETTEADFIATTIGDDIGAHPRHLEQKDRREVEG